MMANLTVTVHTRGRHRMSLMLRLVMLLINLRLLHVADSVARHMGLWYKINVGKHSQWHWMDAGVRVVKREKAVHDG